MLVLTAEVAGGVLSRPTEWQKWTKVTEFCKKLQSFVKVTELRIWSKVDKSYRVRGAGFLKTTKSLGKKVLKVDRVLLEVT